MDREDSGIIDLNAIQNRASNTPPVPTPLSSPPAAFTMEAGDLANSGEVEFRPRLTKKKKIMIGAGVAGAALFLGIIAFSGGKPAAPEKTAAAAAAPEPTFTVARPAPSAPEPPPVVAAAPAKPVPPPPATGNASSGKAPRAAARAPSVKLPPKAGLTKVGGGKLTKIQSSGT